MSRNYFAGLRNSQTTSSNLLSDPQRQKRKKSKSALNSLAKPPEKTSKPTTNQKPIKNIGIIKPFHFKTSHQSKYSEIPRVSLSKSKLNKDTKKKVKHQSICDVNASLSDSYDLFLSNFQCGKELRNSLKRLVLLEKSELKRKFNRSKVGPTNSIFFNSYHNSKAVKS